MKHCTICWLPCKQTARYCWECWRLLIRNRTTASNIQKKLWYKLCPICFKKISKQESFCEQCSRVLKKRKILFSKQPIMKGKEDYLELNYTYVIKDPVFFRQHKKDYVKYKIIELELRTWYKFTQNLELLYKEWLPKRNRFQSKQKYFDEYLVPIIRKQYERWRLNAIGFWVDVAVEMILQEWKKNQNESS